MENIDKIFYINLDKRNDRKEQIEKQLFDYGITNYERIAAVFHPMGSVGCGLSHLKVLQIAKERGYKRILILEDDFEFLVSKEEFEKNIEKLKDVNFEACFLSYNLLDFVQSEEHDFLLRAFKCHTSAGYIINKTSFDMLIKEIQETNHLLEQTGYHWIYANDVVWNKLQKKYIWYCFKTRIGKQRNGFSDITQEYVERNT